MKFTYLGTASMLLEPGGVRMITDPVFDEAGGTYDMGPAWVPSPWFSSTREYVAPMTGEQVGPVDAALLSHDHHSDNLDYAGRAYVLGPLVDTIVTNPAAAARLSAVKDDVRGLAIGESTTVAGVTITSTPARHGPRFTPQVYEVTGFLLQGAAMPTVWISGDTVMTPDLWAWLADHSVDVAIINCGAAHFPAAPLLGRSRFTFNPTEVVQAARLLESALIVPVHRSGWTHFEPESRLRAAIDEAGLDSRTRWLEPGESLTL